MFKVAIITVNYNGKENTLELLKSVEQLNTVNCEPHAPPLEVKTVVVDNASSDNSVSEIHKKFPQVDVLQTGANLGFGEGLNKGIDYGKIWGADYFFVINNDSIIGDPDILQKLIKVFKKDPKIGVVAPRVLFQKGYEFHKDRYEQKDLGKVIWYGGGSFDWDNVASIHRGIDEVDSAQYDLEEETDFITGACFLVKKEVLEKVKFDGEYFLYFEDADFNKQVKEIGFKLYYLGKTFIYHKVSQSTGIGSNLTDYFHSRNRLIFGFRYAKLRTKFALLRESLKLLILGRKYQRMGILDFYLRISGPIPGAKLNHPPGGQIEYPFKLSIGIVNYNTADLTRKLLDSIFEKGSGFNENNMEVIVLDNGKVDPSLEKIKEYLPRIKYLKNEENEGFSKGYNRTIKFSLGENYLMLNSDIEVLNGALSEMVKVAEQFKGEAVLGGKLVFPDRTKQDSAFHLPTIWGALQEYFLKKKGSYFMFEPEGERVSKVEGLVMACFLIPRKVLEKAGLLDKSKFIFFEDIEYCRRLKELDIPIYYVPTAKFIHHHGASTKKIGLDKATSFLTQSSIKYHGKFYYFLLTFVLRLGQLIGRVKTPISRWTKD